MHICPHCGMDATYPSSLITHERYCPRNPQVIQKILAALEAEGYNGVLPRSETYRPIAVKYGLPSPKGLRKALGTDYANVAYHLGLKCDGLWGDDEDVPLVANNDMAQVRHERPPLQAFPPVTKTIYDWRKRQYVECLVIQLR